MGKVQASMLARIEAAPAGANVNRLQWEMAEEVGAVERDSTLVGPFESGRIAPAFYGSFRRALRTCAAIGKRLESRRCVDFDDLNASYPYRSLQLHVRQLRERVLPLVREYLEENRKRQFNPADTELYLLETRIPDEAMEDAEDRWRRIKAESFSVLASLTGEAQQSFLEVLVKAEQLFRNKSISHEKSLPRLVKTARDAVASGEGRATELLDEITSIYQAAIPKDLLSHASFKSRLCSIIDFGQARTRAAFKPEFKTWLLNRDPDLVTSLPEHKSHRSRLPRGFAALGPDLLTRFSPVLDQAIGRDALQAQVFVAARR